jgi:RNA polymerase sigma factor for flagellar operon FliA
MNETAKLWTQYTKHGDRKAREELIMHYAPLVKYVVGRLAIGLPASMERDDLVNCGVVGLIEAVDRFQPDRGVKFETYAIARIRGQIIDTLRSLDPLPRSAHQRVREIEAAMAQLTQTLGRTPDDSEVAKHLGITVDDYRSRLAATNLAFVSLDRPVQSADGEQLDLYDSVEDDSMPTPSDHVDRQEALARVVSAIHQLPERERLMISLYYNDRLTLKEIGNVLNISESRVCQIHAKALLMLRSIVNGSVMPAPVVYQRRAIGVSAYATAR